MKQYTVVWSAIARDQLAEIWLRTLNRGVITAGADTIDRRLADQPAECGEALADGQISMTVGFLRVFFQISEPDRSVEVYHVEVIDTGNGRAPTA